MVVVSLVEEFISLCLGQSKWKDYEQLYPEIFDHYFRYWCPSKWDGQSLDTEAIRARAHRVTQVLDPIESQFRLWQLDTSALKIVLFVGGNTSNGHAFLDRDQWVVWIPVETYRTDQLARIFITHEVVHGLHYSLTPEFYFSDESSKNHLGRQIITEGVATFLTAQVLGVSDRDALWADYLSAEKYNLWLQECQRRTPELGAMCRSRFLQSTPELGIFKIIDPTDILTFRAGYFVGLSLVQNVSEKEKLGPTDLLTLDRHQFEKFVLRELKAWK